VTNTGQIEGLVYDGEKPIGGARIKLRHNDPNDTREVPLNSDLLTYSNGTYYFAGIAPGKYRAYIDPKQLALLHFTSTPEYIDFESSNKEADDFKGGLNFVLKSSDKVLLNQPLQSKGSFNIAMSDSVVYFDPGALATIHGTISNLTHSQVGIIFHRTHLRLPDSNWTSSVCFGLNCFSSKTDSIPETSAFILDPGLTGDFILNLLDPEEYNGVDSLVDYIRFTAVGSDAGDTLSYVLKAVLRPQSGVQDNQPKPIGNPKIVTIYPSPLVQGSAIKVKVSSPRESNLSYSIYDGLGRVVALGVTRQHIGLGDNTVSISSLDGLSNGSYMLKFNFGDGSSDTHFFQVLK
jgi:hypothetical protein